MSKGETLLAAAPLLWQIDIFGGKVYSFLHDRVLFKDYDNEIDIQYVQEWLDFRPAPANGNVSYSEGAWHGLSVAERITKALTQDPLGKLECGGLGGMRRSLEVITTTTSAREMFSAAEVFVDSVDEYSLYFAAQAKDAFGHWGARLFDYVIEDLPFEYVERLSRSFAIAPDPQSLTELPQLELERQLFAVRYGDREPCVLGNTRQFRLFEALLQRQGRFVSFSDLAEAMGGGAVDADLLPAIKCRLVRLLRGRGLEDLAQRIKVEPEHYGLFLS